MIAETKTGFFRKNEVDMRYEHTVKGRFLERPNRFIAYVDVNGQRVICQCKKYRTLQRTAYLRLYRGAGISPPRQGNGKENRI